MAWGRGGVAAGPPSLAKCRAAIAACTDVGRNAEDKCGNGDQSFVRAALSFDPGSRVARNSGMDFPTRVPAHALASADLLFESSASPFALAALACMCEQLEVVEAAIELARRSKVGRAKALRQLLRFLPLLFCIACAQSGTRRQGAVP